MFFFPVSNQSSLYDQWLAWQITLICIYGIQALGQI